MHTAVHEAWNARIQEEYGHPMQEIEDYVQEHLILVKQNAPHLTQLAITACLEHWTAGLGHLLLCSDTGRQMLTKFAEPQRSLWVWHATEEIEHKAVSLDVYHAMGGGYIRRCFFMLMVSYVVLSSVFCSLSCAAAGGAAPVVRVVGHESEFNSGGPSAVLGGRRV
jgi:predicted metal-dependent hydrolase